MAELDVAATAIPGRRDIALGSAVIAFNRGIDNKVSTPDDIEIGPVEVTWTVEEFPERFDDDDRRFVGALDSNGLFTPAPDGPNPERRKMPLHSTAMKSQPNPLLRSPACCLVFAVTQVEGVSFTVWGELTASAYSFQPSGGLLPLAI